MTAEAQRSEDDVAEAQVVSITRYPNRRLYDRTQARYITLPEIADLVRQGKTVAVRDNKTGEDLTRTILTQIILEHHPERMDMLPVGILNSMIRANKTTLALLRDYFLQSLSYLEVLQRSAPVNPLALPMAWMRTLLPPLQLPSSSAATDDDPGALAHRVAELEKRLEELQTSAGKPAPQPTSRAQKSRRGGRGPKP